MSTKTGNKKSIVIIGGGVAAMTLAMNLVRKDLGLDIVVVKKEPLGSYSPCGMPFVLEGKVNSMEDILLNSPEFYRSKGIDLRTETEAVNLDIEKRTATLDTKEILNYDVLAIATGRKPFIPPFKGVELTGVYTLSNYEDGLKVKEAMKDTKSAVIIGAGIIGLETAVAFAECNIKTTVIEMLPSVLPQILDPDMAQIVQTRMEGMGIRILLSSKVHSIEGEGKVESVKTEKEEYPADLVLIATGAGPNSDLAKNAGLAMGRTGGIATNSSLNVKKDDEFFKNIFALGDCVEVADAVSGAPKISALASTCALQARIVADNIAGGDSKLKGYLSPAVTVTGDLHIGSVGLTSHSALQSVQSINTGMAQGPTRSSYYPGRKQITIKILVNEDRIIGAQMISEEDVKERVNALTLTIQNKMTISELLFSERSFTPPLSMLVDPLIRALESIEDE